LSYEEAQAAIDGEPSDRAAPLLETVLKPLWAAYAALKNKRSERSPLDLDIPERKIELSPDGEVLGVRVRDRFDAHMLIEEMMIQANVCAAEALETKRHELIYRVHEEPSDEKIHGLSTFLETLDLSWSMGEKVTPARFNRLLAIARETDRHHEISEIVLRSQSQAVYSPDNLGHFGLNLTKYAHFTSPIRRYSDLIVHRALIRAYGLGPDGLDDQQRVRLEEIAGHLVDRERASMAAERDASDRYLTAFLQDRVGAEFEGRITGVAKFGLFVRLDETAADGFVPAASLGDEYWFFDDGASALVAEHSARR
ncbi:MAG TPA: ribonuclease R, partial [Hyphomonadaceae bacterium]|nr:ribonuclease R [Hyphomonadaceae bacterium]